MAKLLWDKVGERGFETGLDKGVLYLQDGTGVVWNGLTSVSEKKSVTVEPLYFDGRKFNDIVTLGDYSAMLAAFTYPDEFLQFEGIVDVGNGVNLSDQRLNRFGLSYRTKVGNDLDGIDAGYKIHIVYNLLATPSDTVYATLSDTANAITFQWELSAVPVDVAGYDPSAHVVFDTTKCPVDLISAIEDKLYGTASTIPYLPPMSYFLNLATVDW